LLSLSIQFSNLIFNLWLDSKSKRSFWLQFICREISQSQNQLVVYRGNHVFYSAYKTVKQTTTVDLPSSTVESYTKYGNPSKDGSSIKYGDAKEFDNVAPFSQVCFICLLRHLLTDEYAWLNVRLNLHSMTISLFIHIWFY